MRSSQSVWRSGGSQWPALGIALTVLGVLGAACGGSPSAAPTPTAAVAASPASVASPARPPLASPIASPVASPSAITAASPAPGEGQSYTVQAGDTLGKIAQDVYGDQTQWRRIYDANKAAIGDDPDALKLDTKLTIPPKQ